MSLTRLVVFDMDGVLADTEPLHLEAARELLAREGVELHEEDVRAFLGRTDEDLFRAFAARFALRRRPEEYAREKAQRVIELLALGLAPNPGVPELLLRLPLRGVEAVVASSSSPPLIRAVVGALGLTSSFRGLFSAHEVGRGKPAPDLFLRAAAARDVPPAECLVIEDAPAGIAAARAAGMRVVALRTEMTRGLDLSAADVVLDSLESFDCDLLLEGLEA